MTKCTFAALSAKAGLLQPKKDVSSLQAQPPSAHPSPLASSSTPIGGKGGESKEEREKSRRKLIIQHLLCARTALGLPCPPFHSTLTENGYYYNPIFHIGKGRNSDAKKELKPSRSSPGRVVAWSPGARFSIPKIALEANSLPSCTKPESWPHGPLPLRAPRG